VAIIAAPRIFTGGNFIDNASIEIRGDRIIAIHSPALPADVSLSSGFLTAGMIDLQVNGFAGTDFVTGTDEGWQVARRAIGATGVTSFLPTFITAPIPTLAAAMTRTAGFLEQREGSRALGFHLEGPFLSERRKGAHDESVMCDPTSEVVDQLLEASCGRLMMVTLAPERAHALTAIHTLTERGVTVSIGHSDAQQDQTLAALDAGAGMVTHLFNAMPAMNHREPGLVGVALTDSRAHLGVIADLHHLSPRVVQLIFAAAADRVVLVTDAIAAATMRSGTYELGGDIVHLADGLPRRSDGTIAGSALTMDEAIRNTVNVCGVPLTQALDSATRIPAETIGAVGIGDLAPGLLADLVWWSPDLRPLRVWVDGEIVHDAGHQV
jgi:N-acetylglucosamine-6-phosphate deacetylase